MHNTGPMYQFSQVKLIMNHSNVFQLVASVTGESRAQWLFETMEVTPALLKTSLNVSRAEVAQAMNMVLFSDLLERVPEGAAYVNDAKAMGRKIVFDHGALRTVVSSAGELPSGHLSFDRILKPLGFTIAAQYPLPRLKMLGRAYAHEDMPEHISQFFVSELYVDQFSTSFQTVANALMATNKDPLTALSKTLLQDLAQTKTLSVELAKLLLPNLIECFGVHHDMVSRHDYELLLNESAEMAWISTEGSAYNHVTDRVPDVMALSEEQRQAGRTIKDTVEVSANGRVRQTAYKAAMIERPMRDESNAVVLYAVPGSFYEFISRDCYINDQGETALDLSFDSGNATGIFAMTSAGASA